MELYHKYRPKNFKSVVGQPGAVKALIDLGKRDEIPHVILFSGPSGCGKTTLARILRKKLNCSEFDFTEINAADSRGIDMVRNVRSGVSAAPIDGDCRIWLIDEVHSLTSDAQNAFLKLLEDTPSHVYFFLATTDPQKLKKTIITRCTPIRCSPLSNVDIGILLENVCKSETGNGCVPELSNRIVEASEGSARQALVFLNLVIGLDSLDEQLAVVASGDVRGQAIEIARALMNRKTKWPKMAEIIKSVQDEDPEQLRWMVLGYAKAVMLGKGDYRRAALIIECFREHWYDSKAAGLVVSCYNVVSDG